MPTPLLMGRPGTYVTEQLLSPPPVASATSPSTAAIAGEHWYGVPGVAFQCQSWQDFVKYFGGFQPANSPITLANPWLADSVNMFFSNGGSSCWVARIVPSLLPPVAASLSLSDGSSTPQPTLQLTAGYLGVSGNVGSWGNSLVLDVIAGSATGRFGLNIYKGGYGAGFLVEQWTDMSMAPTDYRYAPTLINATSGGSLYVYATDLHDTQAFPLNAPAVQSNVAFTHGLDVTAANTYVGPSASDRQAAVTYGSAPAAPFDSVPGVLNVALPGETTTAVVSALINYAAARPATFAVLDSPSGLTPTAAIAFAATVSPLSQYAAIYYPWPTVRNPASSNLQANIIMPPSGLVLGQYANTDAQKGPWIAPAGVSTRLAGAVGTERSLSPTDLANLNLANINTIRQRHDMSVVIWGTRTLSSAFDTLYIPVRRTLNYIESLLVQLMEPFVFAPNDALTWSYISNAMSNFLTGLFTLGAFAGSTADASFYVICDDTVNTPTSIQQGQINAVAGLALEIPAEFIILNIQQFQTTGTVSVQTSQVAA